MHETESPAPANLSKSQLETLCAALGWQGGTYWQVVDEVRRLKLIADGVPFNPQPSTGALPTHGGQQ